MMLRHEEVSARPVRGWDIDPGHMARPPRGVTHVVLDTPAGLHGKLFQQALALAGEFTEQLGLPVLGCLRPTQNYIHLAARGLTLFDVAPSRVERDLEQWQDLCRWLDS